MTADDDGAADGSMFSLKPGSRIADYRLEEHLGQGGMAVVFRAHDERLGRNVALKILAPALAANREFQQRFISESRAAAAIDDPHIVPVFAAGEADGMLFIAMRYVSGGDALSMLHREGPLPLNRAAGIISPVASALDAAHRVGLVHRDVKPSNILMDVLPGRPAHVYLSDFGLSKAVASTSGLTAAGTILGTLAYMSPEQIRTQPVDGRADQYALACSAFELLTGAPPFQRDEPTALMYAHLSVAPPPLTSRRSGLPPAADAVLSKALAKEPDDRYASCGQFADALRDALGLQPYRAGLRARTVEVPPVPEIAWPETQDAVRPSRLAPAPATVSPAPVTVEAIVDGGQLSPGGDGGQARPRRPRRLLFVIGAGVVATGLTTGLLLAPGSPAPKPAATALGTVSISVKSAQPTLTGDVYVVYGDGTKANAEVSGAIGKAADGEIAELYAQQFPYHDPPTMADSVILHTAGGTATYTFQVTPVLATRYLVKLFQSSTASAPFAVSGVKTVYVTLNATHTKSPTCGGPVCYESAATTYTVPPTALQAEMSKQPYLYFGIDLAENKPTSSPPAPKTLSLGRAI